MNFSLVSSSSEISCSKSLKHKNEKLLVTKSIIRLGSFGKQNHRRPLNHDVRKIGVSQPLMPEHVEESYILRMRQV
ncbi:hypothetical protein BVC80_8593g5 [Macleaya cordata]|uniref:Uncharacterized protein n=1 Tax=Macleaya cordata TaxID=56857 RepID=A0A200PP71_MACCD|nr:hypothetical protein BVC80_8593g5 [Macleaya cordata]